MKGKHEFQQHPARLNESPSEKEGKFAAKRLTRPWVKPQ